MTSRDSDIQELFPKIISFADPGHDSCRAPKIILSKTKIKTSEMTTINQTSSKHDKTFNFEINLDWLGNKRGILTANDVKDTLRVALPKAFGGLGNEWSPEHLFLGSISSCFMTTYLVFADKMGFDISHLETHADGRVELVDGRYEFTQINIHAKIFIPDESLREKSLLALAKAQKYCLVSNSVKATISHNAEILLDKHPLHSGAIPFSCS
jgi:peroxiredoxin-like protein